MINPPPRPALRKAPDTHVHPVAALPPVPLPAPRPELRPVVGIGGRTSDTLVTRKPKGSKRTTLEVKVPKSVAKSARRTAKVRGERIDDIVSAALRAYVERG